MDVKNLKSGTLVVNIRTSKHYIYVYYNDAENILVFNFINHKDLLNGLIPITGEFIPIKEFEENFIVYENNEIQYNRLE